jgi:hypothetical protein
MLVDVQEEQNLAGGKWPALVQETIQGAINTSLLQPTDQIVSIFYRYRGATKPLQICARPADTCLSDKPHQGRYQEPREPLVVPSFTMQADRARVPHTECGKGRGAGQGAALAAGAQHLVPRPVWQLQVRGRQPRPFAHAGRGGCGQHPVWHAGTVA